VVLTNKYWLVMNVYSVYPYKTFKQKQHNRKYYFPNTSHISVLTSRVLAVYVSE
jgi:hypothetical protein